MKRATWLAAEGRAYGGGRWTALGSGPRGAAESAGAQRWTARASAAGESAGAQRPQAVQGRRPARAAPRRGRPSRLRLGPLARPRLEAAPPSPPARAKTKTRLSDRCSRPVAESVYQSSKQIVEEEVAL